MVISLAVAEVTGTQLATWREQIDGAVYAADAAELEAMQGVLAGEVHAGPEADLLDYYRAYLSYRLGELSAGDKRAAKAHLNACIEGLKLLLARRPDMAEAHGLQATCYGASTQYYMLRAAGRGMASGRALGRALELAPKNPRVVFQEALSYYARPAAFGGDKERARQRFQEAAQLFATWQSPGPGWPQWGEAESWLFIGRLEATAGDTAAARNAFETALALAPGYVAVQTELDALP